MRWYVKTNGETTGPVEGLLVATWVREGRLGSTTLFAPEGANYWITLAQSPFAPRAAKRLSPITVLLLVLAGGGTMLFGSCVVCVGLGSMGASKPGPLATSRPIAREAEPVERGQPVGETPALTPAANLCDGSPLKSTGDMVVSCKDVVREQLKAPSTAEFQGIMSTSAPSTLANCDQTWVSWVEASNSFGAVLRTNFVCTYHRASDSFSVRLEQ